MPNCPFCNCPKHVNKRKLTLQTCGGASCKSLYIAKLKKERGTDKLATQKAIITKNKIGSDGLTGHQKSANKAAGTRKHYQHNITTKLKNTLNIKTDIRKSKREQHCKLLRNAYARKLKDFNFIIFIIDNFSFTKMKTRFHNLKLSSIDTKLFDEYFSWHPGDFTRLKTCEYKPCNVIYKFKVNKLYCSDNCQALYNTNKTTQGSIEYRLKLSKIGRATHLAKQIENPQYIKDWVKHYMATLGPEGIIKRSDSIIKSKLKNGTIQPYELMSEYKIYSKLVWKFTNRQNHQSLENSELRGHVKYLNNAHHLDHMYSIFAGFNNDIPPELIGAIENLKYITAHENVKKGVNISFISEAIKQCISENNVKN